MNSLPRNLLVTVMLLLLLSDTAVTDGTATTAPPISVMCTNLSYWQCYNVNDKKVSKQIHYQLLKKHTSSWSLQSVSLVVLPVICSVPRCCFNSGECWKFSFCVNWCFPHHRIMASLYHFIVSTTNLPLRITVWVIHIFPIFVPSFEDRLFTVWIICHTV